MKKLFLLRSDELKTESQAFRQVILGYRPDRMAGTRLKFQTSPQPLFHKNFDLLADSLAGSIAEGIRTLQAETSGEATLYDLQGRPVTKPQGGIYVKDGKKVFVK